VSDGAVVVLLMRRSVAVSKGILVLGVFLCCIIGKLLVMVLSSLVMVLSSLQFLTEYCYL
jgi:hypothetical protein